MEMNYEDLQRIVEDSVDRVMKRNGYAHKCHLNDTEINKEIHMSHHYAIRRFLNDWSKIRTAFLAGVLVTAASGAGALIWLGIQNVVSNGGV